MDILKTENTAGEVKKH